MAHRAFLEDNHIKFYPGIRFQDVPFTHECYLKAGKCIRTSWLLNIYRVGHESATYSFSKQKAKEFCIAIAETWKLHTWEGHEPKTLQKLQDDVFVSFSHLTTIISYSIKNSSDRAEIIDHLRQLAPDMTFTNGFKQRAVSMFYRTLPHCYIHLHYYGRQLKKLLK